MNTVEFAIESFKATKSQAEPELHSLQSKLEGHQHGKLCFGWRGCRQDEQRLEFVASKVQSYQEAVDGLLNGDFSKAVDVLYMDAHLIDQNLKREVFHSAMKGGLPLSSISSSIMASSIMVQRMTELASKLEAISVQGIPQELKNN